MLQLLRNQSWTGVVLGGEVEGPSSPQSEVWPKLNFWWVHLGWRSSDHMLVLRQELYIWTYDTQNFSGVYPLPLETPCPDYPRGRGARTNPGPDNLIVAEMSVLKWSTRTASQKHTASRWSKIAKFLYSACIWLPSWVCPVLNFIWISDGENPSL